MEFLVTGGAGFIGSHLVDTLFEIGNTVYVIDNLSSGKLENLNPSASFYKMDICDQNLCELLCNIRPEVVFHLAAQVSVPCSIQNPYEDARVNVLGTINLLEACVKAGVKRVIFSSSAAVYGVPIYFPINEAHPLHAISHYGVSKVAAEEYIKLYQRMYGTNYVILRYANVYGPRQDAEGEGGVVSIFANRLASKDALTIFGSGEQTRDFIYVKDVVRANLAAATCSPNLTINVSTGEATSINKLAQTMISITNTSVEVIYQPERQGDIQHSVLSPQLAWEVMGWKPNYKLEDGLKDMLLNSTGQ
ncbi:MAG: NAD-dependent epimerase/dehydratase family protein [Clostridiales bacterium]|mgnify:CR=1 FL=1|jgi:UDP-glucose 4-epimerase|nr:NAD-dependent epimerase/dehydratase family protein [Clostridiales bacterium]